MSAYTQISTEQIRAWLTQALTARQQQMIGPTSVGSEDRRVSFERSKADLDAYITDLRNELAERESPDSRGPIVIGF